MTYQDMATMYKEEGFRQRIEMCIREQGMVYTHSDKAHIAALGNGCVASNWIDIDAVIAAVSVSTAGAPEVTGDEALKTEVQAVWETVARARYPQLVGQPGSIFRYAASPGAMPPTVLNTNPVPSARGHYAEVEPPPLPQTKDDTPCEDCP